MTEQEAATAPPGTVESVIPGQPFQPLAAPAQLSAPAVNMDVSQNVTMDAPSVVIMQRSTGPGFLVRAIWFLFIGWWLSALAIGVAYLLCATIIGLPVGFAIFNRLPLLMTLRPRNKFHTIEVRDGVTYVTGGTMPQYPIWARALWFICVGWWIGFIYLYTAWALCVLIVTMPIGLWLFNRTGRVMTLLKY